MNTKKKKVELLILAEFGKDNSHIEGLKKSIKEIIHTIRDKNGNLKVDVRIGTASFSNSVLSGIFKRIEHADIVIVDFTSNKKLSLLNYNTVFEYGLIKYKEEMNKKEKSGHIFKVYPSIQEDKFKYLKEEISDIAGEKINLYKDNFEFKNDFINSFKKSIGVIYNKKNGF